MNFDWLTGKKNNNTPPRNGSQGTSGSKSNSNTSSNNTVNSTTTKGNGKPSTQDMDKIRAIVKQESERRMVGFRKQMAEVTKQRDSLQLQLNRTQAELEGVKADNNLRGGGGSGGGNGQSTKNNDSKNVNQNNELVDRLREQLEESNTRLAISESEKFGLQESLNVAMSNYKEAQAQADAFEAMESDLQNQFSQKMIEYKEKVKELEVNIKTKDTTLRLLKEENTKFEKNNQNINDSNNEIVLNLKNQLNNEKEKYIKLEKDMNAKNRNFEVTLENNNELKKRVAGLENEMKLIEQEKDNLLNEIKQLEINATNDRKTYENNINIEKEKYANMFNEMTKKNDELHENIKVKEQTNINTIKQMKIEMNKEMERNVQNAIVTATLKASNETDNEKTKDLIHELQLAQKSLVESNKTIENLKKDHIIEMKNAINQAITNATVAANDVAAKNVKVMQDLKAAHEVALQAAIEETKKKSREEATEVANAAKAAHEAALELAVKEALDEAETKSQERTQKSAEEAKVAHEAALELALKEALEEAQTKSQEMAQKAADEAIQTGLQKAAVAHEAVLQEAVKQASERAAKKSKEEQIALQETLEEERKKNKAIENTVQLLKDNSIKIKNDYENELKKLTIKLKNSEQLVVDVQDNINQSIHTINKEKEENEKSVLLLNNQLNDMKIQLDASTNNTIQVRKKLNEKIDLMKTEHAIVIKNLSDEHLLKINQINISNKRNHEKILNKEKDAWRNETEELLRKHLEDSHEEWKKTKAKELEKSLAFWRNTWDVEKDRAIQEAIKTEKTEWEKNVDKRISNQIIKDKVVWENETKMNINATVKELEEKHHVTLESHLAKHQAELSAVSSAYEVARELQSETLLSLNDVKNENSKLKMKLKNVINNTTAKINEKCTHIQKELKYLKSSMLALKREASAFQRQAPQINMLQNVLNQWYQDEEWNEHDGTLDPPPNCSLNDPVITHLLSSWTNDSKKLKLLSNWLKHVLSNKKIKSTKSFRPGVELTKLPLEVSEGFLRIVVPMLRSRDDIDVSAHYRTRRETWRELRLRVSKRGEMPPFTSGNSGTPVHNKRTIDRLKLQSRSVNAFSSPSMVESSSQDQRNQRSESDNAISNSITNSGSNNSNNGGVGNPFSVKNNINQTKSVNRLSGGMTRHRRHSSGGDMDLNYTNTQWESSSDASSRSSTPSGGEFANSPWMQTPVNHDNQVSGSSSDERKRRGSWAGQSSPRNSDSRPPPHANRRLNLSKINNRLSKLRDFN